MKLISTIVFAAHFFFPSDPEDGWVTLARVKFTSIFFKEMNEYFLVPSFTPELRAKIGKEFSLKGHYIPFDLEGNAIVLSKNPYASCFFCGGAGPESVAEINFKTKRPKLKADQIITVKGKLRLNGTDVNHMNFILDEAEILTP
jgi:hypothetical protein